jgi:aldose 1-epimerase
MAKNFEFINLTRTIQNSIIKAKVSTCGASIKSLSVNGIDMITPTTGHELNPYADGIVMAPWANRIDRGIWELNGEKLQLEITDTEFGNATHGLIKQQLFDIKKQSDSEVTLETVILPSTGYPFEILVQVIYRLTDAGLEVSFEAKNLSDATAPFIIGGHPYFQIGDTAVEGSDMRAIREAVLAGAHRSFPAAQKAMTSLKKVSYKPRAGAQKTYNQLYTLYRQLHDSLGGLNKAADLSRVMKDLLAIKEEARS